MNPYHIVNVNQINDHCSQKDKDKVFHFIQYCLIMHSLTAIAIRICRPLGQSPHANDVVSAVIIMW